MYKQAIHRSTRTPAATPRRRPPGSVRSGWYDCLFIKAHCGTFMFPARQQPAVARSHPHRQPAVLLCLPSVPATILCTLLWAAAPPGSGAAAPHRARYGTHDSEEHYISRHLTAAEGIKNYLAATRCRRDAATASPLTNRVPASDREMLYIQPAKSVQTHSGGSIIHTAVWSSRWGVHRACPAAFTTTTIPGFPAACSHIARKSHLQLFKK
jgi:hypothetical protein